MALDRHGTTVPYCVLDLWVDSLSNPASWIWHFCWL